VAFLLHPCPDLVLLVLAQPVAPFLLAFGVVRLDPDIDHAEELAETESLGFGGLDIGKDSDSKKPGEIPLPVAILDRAAVVASTMAFFSDIPQARPRRRP
jgi:hypothetical protein